MKKIKILYIVNSTGLGSGVMTFIMNLLNKNQDMNIQIDFLVNSFIEPNYDENLTTNGSKIYKHYIPRKSLRGSLKYLLSIRNFFETTGKDYDIVHSHVPLYTPIYFYFAKKNNIKIRISHSHSSKGSSNMFGEIRNLPIILLVKYVSTHYIACSKQAARFLFGHKRAKKTLLINNSIDTSRFQYNNSRRNIVRKSLNLTGETVIGHVGRFSPEKNHYFLVNLFEKYHTLNPSSILLLVGEGSLKNEIMEYVKQKGLSECVKFLGIRNDVDQLMNAMDIFILPSYFEGLGFVAIEAQSTGLPCIVSSNLPSELNQTPIIKRLSLNEEYEKWINCIEELLLNERKDFSSVIAENGYDANINVKLLNAYYKKIYDSNRKD